MSDADLFAVDDDETGDEAGLMSRSVPRSEIRPKERLSSASADGDVDGWGAEIAFLCRC